MTSTQPVHPGTRPANRPVSRPVGDPDTGLEILSPRELEVVSLIARGLSNEEIGTEMYLSTNTVKTYVRSAYRKIGATRRPQAIIWAAQHGLISAD